ncbi:MAG: FxsA family protein [Rhodospirillales bacterium]|nr:FxsA family protein [Rhodospirillales bacterium]
MRFLITAAVLAVPILDIASLIAVGARIGIGPTIAAVILSGFAGGILMRAQGFTLFQQARAALAAGRFPAREVFDGACVLAGGALLMLPGFVSDVLGLLLLAPPVRGLLRRLIGAAALRSGRFEVFTVGPDGIRRPPGTAPTIEGEYHHVEETPPLIPPPAEPENDSPGSRPASGRSPWQQP